MSRDSVAHDHQATGHSHRVSTVVQCGDLPDRKESYEVEEKQPVIQNPFERSSARVHRDGDGARIYPVNYPRYPREFPERPPRETQIRGPGRVYPNVVHSGHGFYSLTLD